MTRTIPDSGIWIDYFNGVRTANTDILDGLIEDDEAYVADLVAMEVLRGITNDLLHARIRNNLSQFPRRAVAASVTISRAGANYRFLRKRGYTIRSVVDCILATYCIDNGFQLLHNDRDFRPFEEHLGLQVLKL